MTSRLSLGSSEMYGDQERDANAQLMELDKGLRSLKVGEQCAAIVKFPRLFEKYPFPVLINSSFLKLADVFRIGSNYLRLHVLTVTKQCGKHLDKILNVDEFIKRIFSVMHSNDPIARAITLNVLGSCACVMVEQKNVHHSIITALDSHDDVELKAAVCAASNFAAQSKTFASGICSKLATMMEGLVTPVDMKLKFIPVFQHMHHDAVMAAKVRDLCTRLLTTYPSRQFVLLILHTLSLLAAKTLMVIPEQVKLLLNYLENDPRRAVKSLAFSDLRLLALKGSHMWLVQDVECLCRYILTTSYDNEKINGLRVLSVLSSSTAVSQFDVSDGSQCYQLCMTCSYHSNVSVSTLAIKVLSHLAVHALTAKSSCGTQMLNDTVAVLESLIVITTVDTTKQNLDALKASLCCIVQLCKASESVANGFVDIIMSTLETVKGPCQILLCECLSAISSCNNSLLRSLLHDFINLLQQVDNNAENDILQVRLCTLIFQASLDTELPPMEFNTVKDIALDLDNWSGYRIARSAARYGQHRLATSIYQVLTSKVSSEHYQFWLHGLYLVTSAEARLLDTNQHNKLTDDLLNRLSEAETLYHTGIITIKAAATPSHSLTFACTYLRLRAECLQAMSQLVKVTHSFQTCPPPAIATSLVMNTGKQVHRFSHIVNQLQCCADQFSKLSTQYTELFCTLFDADSATLAHVQILQQSCRLVMSVIQSILNRFQEKSEPLSLSSLVPQINSEPPPIEEQCWITTLREVIDKVKQTESSIEDGQLGYQHMQCLQGIVNMIAGVPMCYPRYLFQSQQATSIKLAISPQPRASEPVSIHFDTCLTITVEGVIQHGRNPGLYRKIAKAHVKVHSKQKNTTQMISETKTALNPTNAMSQEIVPRNDYFTKQFILSFPVCGLHQVTIETLVSDENGTLWHTGPTNTLQVKSYDEAVQRQAQHHYASQRQAQRTGSSTSVAT